MRISSVKPIPYRYFILGIQRYPGSVKAFEGLEVTFDNWGDIRRMLGEERWFQFGPDDPSSSLEFSSKGMEGIIVEQEATNLYNVFKWRRLLKNREYYINIIDRQEGRRDWVTTRRLRLGDIVGFSETGLFHIRKETYAAYYNEVSKDSYNAFRLGLMMSDKK